MILCLMHEWRWYLLKVYCVMVFLFSWQLRYEGSYVPLKESELLKMRTVKTLICTMCPWKLLSLCYCVFLFSWLKLPFCLNLHAKLEIEMTKHAQKEYYNKYILFHGYQYEINKGIHRWIEQINKDRNYNSLKISFRL